MKQQKVTIIGFSLIIIMLLTVGLSTLKETKMVTTETEVIASTFPTTLSTSTTVASNTDSTKITTTTTTTKVDTTKSTTTIMETVMPKVITTAKETTKKATTETYSQKQKLTALQNEIYGYVLSVCKQYPNVNPAMVMAIIEHESNFNRYAVNYNGTCFGLMQIYVYYHQSRMNRLGVTDIYDAYGNILVGVDLLDELYRSSGNWSDALYQYSGGMSSYYSWVMNRMAYYE